MFRPRTKEERISDLELLYACVDEYREKLSRYETTFENAKNINKLENWRDDISAKMIYLKSLPNHR